MNEDISDIRTARTDVNFYGKMWGWYTHVCRMNRKKAKKNYEWVPLHCKKSDETRIT